jgi:transposase-like protein
MRQERESLIMAARRRFSAAFKRQVVEEMLAGAATMAQVCRRYELCQTVVRTWKEQYAQGRLADSEGVGESQQQRLQELERMVGQLTMENALLKRAVAYTLQRRSEASSPLSGPRSAGSRGGVS